MGNNYYDIIIVLLAIIVATIFMIAAAKEVHKSMKELDEHNRAKKLLKENKHVSIEIREHQEATV